MLGLLVACAKALPPSTTPPLHPLLGVVWDLDGWSGEQVFLIAGAGHTRKDRGVPVRLDREALVIELTEVDAQRLDASAYDPATADLRIFTPRHEREDPCARIRPATHHHRG